MFKKLDEDSFYNVAVCFIAIGAVIATFGMLAWLIGGNLIAYPFFKVIAGLLIMSLGYIQLELGLLRSKK